jgi:leader peptidase (prepilin peptidase)/N-methyltransferase
MPEAAVVVLAAAVGLIFGSFATVLVWRVPRDESIVSPPSHCPSCSAPVKPYDNIPVISFLLLKGHCRNCGAKIGWRYPLVELLVAGLFVATALRLPSRWYIPAYCLLALALVTLAWIDIEHQRLPVAIVYPAVVGGAILLVVAAAGTHNWDALIRALIGGLAGTAVFYTIFFVSKGGMGFGDVRLAGLCGMFLGFLGWRYLVVGFVATAILAGVIAIALVAAGKAGRKTRIPYGPFMAAGTMVAVLYGAAILRIWQIPT